MNETLIMKIYETVFRVDVMISIITLNLIIMFILLILFIIIFRGRKKVQNDYKRAIETVQEETSDNFKLSIKKLQKNLNAIQEQQNQISMQYSNFLSKQYSDYKKIQNDTKIMSGLISQNENMQKELGRLRAILKRKDRA